MGDAELFGDDVSGDNHAEPLLRKATNDALGN
jgi:hypothetical protein